MFRTMSGRATRVFAAGALILSLTATTFVGSAYAAPLADDKTDCSAAAHARNDGHRVVADWQRRGLVSTIVTQNVDGFHTRAGAADVLELHGTLANVRCDRCATERPAAEFLDAAGLACACGGKRRPGVVLFGEALPEATLRAAWLASERATLFVVLGSSLAVAPANLLPRAAAEAGAPLVIVNRDPTPLDHRATLVIHASIGETLRAADRLLLDQIA